MLLLGVGAASLAACAGLPGKEMPTGPNPVAAYASDQSLAAPAADWPTSDWWTAYGDPQLNGLIAEALAGSPDMATAKARIEKSRAALSQVRVGLYPTLKGQASVAEAKDSYNNGIPALFVPKGYNDIGAAQLNFSYDFDFWGKTPGGRGRRDLGRQGRRRGRRRRAADPVDRRGRGLRRPRPPLRRARRG